MISFSASNITKGRRTSAAHGVGRSTSGALSTRDPVFAGLLRESSVTQVGRGFPILGHYVEQS